MAEEIQNYVAAGGTVLGICGGFQMLGKILADPEGIEGQEGRYKGLGLLPLKTVIAGQKLPASGSSVPTSLKMGYQSVVTKFTRAEPV